MALHCYPFGNLSSTIPKRSFRHIRFQMLAQQRLLLRVRSISSSLSLSPSTESRYFIPRVDRTESKKLYELENGEEGKLVRVDRFTPTRELNYTPHNWRRHKSVWRRLQHMKTMFKSDSFQRLIFPDLFITGSTALAVTYYNVAIATDYASQLIVDGTAMAGTTTAISLLAAFRLNASYGRYQDGRMFLGDMINASRNLAGNTMMWIESKEQKYRMLKLIKAYPVSMQWHLNEKGGHYRARRKDTDSNFEDQMYAEFYAEMHDIFQDENDKDFKSICMAQKTKAHGPLCIISAMRLIIAQNGGGASVDYIHNRHMDEHVQRLVNSIGMCEKVVRTPIPTCFTRHTSRLFFLWSNLLPFAMYSSCGPIWTLPASIMVSYAVVGIEDVGVQLEEPFNILPLRQYAEGVYDGVDNIQNSYEIGNK